MRNLRETNTRRWIANSCDTFKTIRLCIFMLRLLRSLEYKTWRLSAWASSIRGHGRAFIIRAISILLRVSVLWMAKSLSGYVQRS